MQDTKNELAIQYVSIKDLSPAEYNPRRWDKQAIEQLTESVQLFGLIDPLICNSAKGRENIVIGGHFRLKIAKDLGFKEVPVLYVNIPDIKKEQELNLRLNKNLGDWDFSLLAEYDEAFLSVVGFSSEELDEIFEIDTTPEVFDLKKELEKLDIKKVSVKKGDLYQLGDHRLFVGDSTVKADVMKLMGKEKADMCFTDEPYLLDYLHGKKRKGKATEGFGLKRDRRYLETESLPDNFIELWMDNVKLVAKEDFSIISFECWKNLPIMWSEMAKRWKVRNMIIWHVPNRVQGFAGKYKFFNKYDFALVGSSGTINIIEGPEKDDLVQNEYETALFATSGSPHWESYKSGKKICPTDFIESKASDEKSSGQGIIFGTKPVEILIPYIKVLTKRNDIIIEPFCGSGSCIMAAQRMQRRCYAMEKSPVYAQVIIKRWETFTGKKAVKLNS